MQMLKQLVNTTFKVCLIYFQMNPNTKDVFQLNFCLNFSINTLLSESKYLRHESVCYFMRTHCLRWGEFTYVLCVHMWVCVCARGSWHVPCSPLYLLDSLALSGDCCMLGEARNTSSSNLLISGLYRARVRGAYGHGRLTPGLSSGSHACVASYLTH
jgi:hypothetical protein